MPITTGNQAFQKQANIALVLKTIHENKLISRVELSRNLGLKKPTVTNIINELIDIGIVLQKEEGPAGITGGRKPVNLALNESAACVIGIEFEIDYYRAVICDLNGKILCSKTDSRKLLPLNESFKIIIDELGPEIKNTGSIAVGIGVGISGTVDIDNEIITRSYIHDLSNYSIKENIKYSLPVFFDNDTNCGAWGELWNRKSDETNFLYLLARFHNHNLNTSGIPNAGMGIVINDEVYYGASFNAGEFDSIHTDNVADFLEKMLRKLSVSFKLLDPQKIILAGDLKYYKDLISETVEKLNKDSYFEKFCFSKTGEMEIAYGAATLVLHRLYRIPQLGKTTKEKGIWWSDIFRQIKDKR